MKRSFRLRLARFALALALAPLPSGAAEPIVPVAARAPGRAGALPPGLAPRWPAGSFELVEEGPHAVARLRLPGEDIAAFVANAAALDPPLDFRGRFPRVELRVDDVKRLGGLALRLSSDGFRESWFEFPLWIFADEHFNSLQGGAWTPTSFSFGSARVVGRPDRSAIDSVGWFVRDRPASEGGGPLTAEWRAFQAVDAAAEGVVSLTFDDGYDEHFSVAAPLLAEHGFRGTAYVMPDQLGLPGYVGVEQARALRDRYGWEVAAHHAKPFTSFAPKELDAEMRRIRRQLSELGFAEGARHLAYPEGRQDPRVVVRLARRHFATARLASGGPETLPPADPHRLRVLNVVRTTAPDEIARAARRAREHHEWLILMFHWLVEDPVRDTDYSIEAFRRALLLLAQEGAVVRTVGEVWDGLAGGRRGTTRATLR